MIVIIIIIIVIITDLIFHLKSWSLFLLHLFHHTSIITIIIGSIMIISIMIIECIFIWYVARLYYVTVYYVALFWWQSVRFAEMRSLDLLASFSTFIPFLFLPWEDNMYVAKDSQTESWKECRNHDVRWWHWWTVRWLDLCFLEWLTRS